MNTPPSVVSSQPPLPTKVAKGLIELDRLSLLSMLCLLLAWFFMNTLVVELGSLQHGIRFFDVGGVIGDPTRLFFGIETSTSRVAFGVLCLACLLAPLLHHLVRTRVAWLAYLAPLALLVLCAVLLYSKTSGEFFAAPSDAKTFGGGLARFPNGIARHGGDLISKHISIAAGAYVALASCMVLAVRGIHHFRRHAP